MDLPTIVHRWSNGKLTLDQALKESGLSREHFIEQASRCCKTFVPVNPPELEENECRIEYFVPYP